MTISANAIITARQAQVPAEDWPESSDAVALLVAGCNEDDEAVGVILSTVDPVLLLPIVAGMAHSLGVRCFGSVEAFAAQLARWQSGADVQWPEDL